MCAAVWNPCITCGACCAFFRASFYWSEADPAGGGLTPPELTTKLTPHHAVMLGTDKVPPRCVALRGHICRILQRMPTPRLRSAGVTG